MVLKGYSMAVCADHASPFFGPGRERRSAIGSMCRRAAASRHLAQASSAAFATMRPRLLAKAKSGILCHIPLDELGAVKPIFQNFPGAAESV
jgi:hypothetical protein